MKFKIILIGLLLTGAIISLSFICKENQIVTNRSRVKKHAFRNSLSVSPHVESMFSNEYSYENGGIKANSMEELQKLYIAAGSTEVWARIATKSSNRGGHQSLSELDGIAKAKLAKKLNLSFNPELGLWATYGDVSAGQPSPDFSDFPEIQVPAEWTSLRLDQMLPILYQYGAIMAKKILATGVKVNVWDLGNEVEYGIAGVAVNPGNAPWYKSPDSIDNEIGKYNLNQFYLWPSNKLIPWLKQHVWLYEAQILKAVSDGIKSVDPKAKFSTHISSVAAVINREIPLAFFKAMNAGGYYPDELGISYYPTIFENNRNRLEDFKTLATQMRDSLNRPVFIAEFGYPASQMSGQYSWNAAVDGYPLTPEGQAKFTYDLACWGIKTGVLSGIRNYGPDFLSDVWGPMCLFEHKGKTGFARPALKSIQSAVNSCSK